MNLARLKKHILIFILVSITVPITLLLQMYFLFPNKIMLFEGEEYIYNINKPLLLDAQVDKSGALSLNGDIVKDKYTVNLKTPLVVKSDHSGSYNMALKLFGVIPLRSVSVNVIPKVSVIPCGNTVGVKLYTDGVLIIGTSDVNASDGKKYSPWRDAGLHQGDIIESIQNQKLKDIAHMTDIIEHCDGKEVDIVVKRRDKEIHTKILPQLSSEDKKYKLGIWVRDSTAGIGTLTFYEPTSKYFGALGHGITDVDTGQLLTVGNGNILNSSILSVKKGKKGSPGELKGIFMNEDSSLGSIVENCEYGIFGQVMNQEVFNHSEAYPIALRNQVKEGPAYILSNIEGESVEKFEIEIVKVMRQNEESSKGMIIRITDKNLLERTGGIVQGMSGSPIIQDGRIVGAVTHVFVNDPSKGYGIFIEWMLNRVANLSGKV